MNSDSDSCDRTPKHNATEATRAIARDALLGDPRTVARDVLLGATLVRFVRGQELRVRLVEVEAYLGESDPGSHAFRGPTPRNRVMYDAPGYAYVYFSYGAHWMLNVVVRPQGTAGAVLLRGAEPLLGDAFMAAERASGRHARAHPPAPGGHEFIRWLLGGPARLAQALAVDRSDYGADMIAAPDAGEEPDLSQTPGGQVRQFRLLEGVRVDPAQVVTTTRVGLSQGADLEYRYYLRGSPGVSRP